MALSLETDTYVVREAIKPIARLFKAKNTLLSIEADESRQEVVFSAIEEYRGISVIIPEISCHTGRVLCSLQTISSFTETLPQTPIFLQEKTNTSLTVFTDEAIATFVLTSPNLYVSAKNTLYPDLISAFTFPASDFCQFIQDIAFAAMTPEKASKPYQSSILVWPASNNQLNFVTSDGRRMAHVVTHCPHFLSQEMLFPTEELAEYVAIIKTKPHEFITCYLSKDTHFAIFSCDNIDMCIYLVEGIFPVFNDIYPHVYTLSCTVATKDLLAAIERAAIYAEKKRVFFDIRVGAIQVSSEKTESGVIQSVVFAKVEGQPLHVELAIDDLLPIVRAIKTSEVFIKSDPQGPRKTMVFSPSDNHVRYSILPMITTI